MSSRIEPRAIARCLAPFPQVVAAWLFGSAQDGVVRPGSDLDIALLFASVPDLPLLADLRTALQQGLAIEEIDLAVLNQAGPVLAFEALRGVLVLCRDQDVVADFASLTARSWEDEMAFLEHGLRLRRILHRSPAS
ncbi:MAG: nucleotidyltransferase domain-containing protein [Thermodesulfobacteriota bacterium]